tara:strand:- start:53 stop:274 length:222 start_codon:yes stop_codon:yes gene_type:complete
MNYQTLFNLAIAIAGFFGGWILSTIYRSIERLDKDVRGMPLMYVTKDDYRHDIDEIKGMLVKIVDKLDAKADR